MKTTQNEHSLAVRGANYLNKLKQDTHGNCYSSVEWMKLFKKYRIPYYSHLVPRAVDSEILKEDGMVIVNNRALATYSFTNKSIDHTTLAPIYEKQRKKGRERKGKELPKPIIFRDSNPEQAQLSNYERAVDMLTFPHLGKFTDKQLVEELRNRGFEVTAEKVTTIKL